MMAEERREVDPFEEIKRKKREDAVKAYIADYEKRAIGSFDKFCTFVQERYGQEREVWSTGFDELDEALNGGFKPEQLIFLGAVSSLGKTSFALQMAAQMAERGRDVLIFSLEMSQNELNAKLVSRYTHVLQQEPKYGAADYRLTTSDILDGKVGNLYKPDEDPQAHLYMKACSKVAEFADHIAICEGGREVTPETIKSDIMAHIARQNAQLPFVIIDYLQILKSPQNLDKRTATNEDVSALKRIARDLRVPILAISSFNRVSYLEPVNMSSFKESGGIEYGADLLLGMQYQDMDYLRTGEDKAAHESRVRKIYEEMTEGSKKDRPQIELKILKQRNGTRSKLSFEFLPAFNNFTAKKQSEEQRPEVKCYPLRKSKVPF